MPRSNKKGEPPEWLIVHRELQYLRAAAMSVPHSARRKKKRKKLPSSYVSQRYRKLREVKH